VITGPPTAEVTVSPLIRHGSARSTPPRAWAGMSSRASQPTVATTSPPAQLTVSSTCSERYQALGASAVYA
jgi:hypothetical protein